MLEFILSIGASGLLIVHTCRLMLWWTFGFGLGLGRKCD